MGVWCFKMYFFALSRASVCPHPGACSCGYPYSGPSDPAAQRPPARITVLAADRPPARACLAPGRGVRLDLEIGWRARAGAGAARVNAGWARAGAAVPRGASCVDRDGKGPRPARRRSSRTREGRAPAMPTDCGEV
ncbi:hypothetical protein C8R44DRAFT_381871 [Mycena epipterygia]|nr:hypothetical protein C8R44DRAFT_381871 [Mycena epipterygia]